jgi:hypothetical protein
MALEIGGGITIGGGIGVGSSAPPSPSGTTYTLGVDFFNPDEYVSQWYDVSIDLYNVVPALKTQLDALEVGDTFLVNGDTTATVYLNNGESNFGVRQYWINVSPGGVDPAIPITSITLAA